MIFGADTPGEAFVSIVNYLHDANEVAPHGVRTKEEVGVHLTVLDPTSLPFDVEGRGLSNRIAAIETCSLIGQTPCDYLQRQLTKSVAEYQDDDSVQYGNYGARVRGQLLGCARKLEHDKDTRQAVITIYDGRADLYNPTYDLPCTLSVQFLIRDDKLVTITTMRSNDAWLGLPYDLHQFCALHCAMAQVMNVYPGHYIHQVGSMHLYRKHWDMELGELYQSDLQHPLFCTVEGDPIHRLQEITTTCQAMLAGPTSGLRESFVLGVAVTNFEEFLVKALS